MKRIETITKIPADFQKVRFHDEKLTAVECPIREIKFGEQLVVIHSDLRWWEQYKKSANIALRPGSEQLNNASEVVRIHKRLMENDFFAVYKTASWTDESIQLMREATKSHFLRPHFKRGAEDEARSVDLGGSRKHTLVYVQLHGQKQKTRF